MEPSCRGEAATIAIIVENTTQLDATHADDSAEELEEFAARRLRSRSFRAALIVLAVFVACASGAALTPPVLLFTTAAAIASIAHRAFGPRCAARGACLMYVLVPLVVLLNGIVCSPAALAEQTDAVTGCMLSVSLVFASAGAWLGAQPPETLTAREKLGVVAANQLLTAWNAGVLLARAGDFRVAWVQLQSVQLPLVTSFFASLSIVRISRMRALLRSNASLNRELEHARRMKLVEQALSLTAAEKVRAGSESTEICEVGPTLEAYLMRSRLKAPSQLQDRRQQHHPRLRSRLVRWPRHPISTQLRRTTGRSRT